MRARGAVLLLWRAVLSLCHRRAVRELLDCAALCSVESCTCVCPARTGLRLQGAQLFMEEASLTHFSNCMRGLGLLLRPRRLLAFASVLLR